MLKLCAETPSMTSDSSVNDIKSFVSYWEETNKKIISIDNRLKDQSLGMRSETVPTLTQSVATVDTPDDEEVPQELVNAIKGLSDFLDKTKISIESDFIKSISDSNALEKELKKFEELIKSVCSEETNLKYINNCAKEIFETEDKSKDWVKSLSKTVDQLNSKWKTVNDKIKNRIDLINKSLQTFNALEEEIISLDKWMDDVNVFLREDIAIGDLETLEQQLEQCNKLQKDIKLTIQSSIDNVNKNASEITKNFNFKNASKFKEINEKWEKLKNATIDKNNKLKIIIQNSNAIHEMLSQTENWIENAKKEMDSTLQVTGTEFHSNISFLKSMLNEISAKQRENKSIKSKLDEMNLDQLNTGSLEELKQRYSCAQQRLGEYEDLISKRITKVKKCQTICGELKRLLMNENDWLDKLAKKLKRSPQLAADAEEISECLDVSFNYCVNFFISFLSFLKDLENYIRNKPNERLDRILEINRELIANQMSSEFLDNEVKWVCDRWDQLSREAKERQTELETTQTESQQCERQLLSILRWIQNVESELQTRFENEVLAEDLPEEVDKMESEFETYAKTLESLKNYTEKYRKQERNEAALRLEEQTKLIQVTLPFSIFNRFRKFKR